MVRLQKRTNILKFHFLPYPARLILNLRTFKYLLCSIYLMIIQYSPKTYYARSK